jgi:hypothetical protein
LLSLNIHSFYQVNKMGKSVNGPLGASHASDTPIWFTLAVPEGIDSLRKLLARYISIENLTNRVHSFPVNFINTLDPNRPAKDSTSNISIPWPKWNTPSAAGVSSLLTFWDAGINVTADEFRSEAVGFLNDLCLSEVQLLYNFVQIGSHASRTPLSITNFGRCHASLRPLSNLQAVTQAPKMLIQRQKD